MGWARLLANGSGELPSLSQFKTISDNIVSVSTTCTKSAEEPPNGPVSSSDPRLGSYVRNVSDPVINGDLPHALQVAWAVVTYQLQGLATSYNGAIATWALIAGGQR